MKIVARNAEIFAKGVDLSGRTNSVAFSMTAEAPDVTSFGNDVRTRLANGLKDAEFSGGGFFDTAASSTDETFSDLMTASTIYGFYPSTASNNLIGYEFGGITTEYSSDFAVADAAMITYTVSASGEVTRGKSLGYRTISDTDSASGYLNSGCSVDFSSSTANGRTIFRVLNITGTSACVSASFQDSGDDSAFSTITDFGHFAVPNSVNEATHTGASQYRRIKYEITATGAFTATLQGFSGSKIGY